MTDSHGARGRSRNKFGSVPVFLGPLGAGFLDAFLYPHKKGLDLFFFDTLEISFKLAKKECA